MDVGGNQWTTDSVRRRVVAPSAPSPRRRTVNYGYPGRNDLQQNYGYTMPQQTNYGYTGAGPKKNNYAQLAMAAAGGAALGVGGYYLYRQFSDRNWDPSVTYNDRSWCTVPSGEYAGRMIRCSDCGQMFDYAACRSRNDCYGGGGCQFELPDSTRRDDLMGTGFIPSEYTAPLTVTITKIVGKDYLASDVCPAQQPNGTFDDAWLSSSSFKIGLYVTLTEMEQFGTAGGSNQAGVASFGHASTLPSWFCLFGLAALAFRRSLFAPRATGA